MSTLQRGVMWLAGCVDNALICFYNRYSKGDGPCGKLQTWARIKRNKKSVMKEKKQLNQ